MQASFKNSHLLTEDIIPVRDVPKYCPTRPSKVTFYRWVNRGITTSNGDRIKLESLKIGSQLVTSVQAVNRFIAASQTEEAA
ncbi:MAG: DUF1580 domain-containing protein [Rubripirellula sp.]|nr:DUF1580 domain-containing protein [Rubripirellula sp.]